MASDPYTVVVTSCARHDLLQVTLASLYTHLDRLPAETVLIEDSGTPPPAAVLDVVRGPLRLIVNERPRGQMAAIDRAYAAVTTPLIFHCEDDWEFFRGGFISASEALLAADPVLSMVSLRARDSLNPLLHALPERRHEGNAYFRAEAHLHPEYFSYSFNPGLRRLADARAHQPFAQLGHEADVSYAFKRAGFVMAYLADPAVRHIGVGRHVDDPAAPRRPRNMVERLTRSLQKRLKRVRRALDNQ